MLDDADGAHMVIALGKEKGHYKKRGRCVMTEVELLERLTLESKDDVSSGHFV